MSKILVTGAAGFVGSQMAYRFYKNGDKVVLVDDFSYGKEDNLIFDDYDFRKEIHHNDIRDIEFMENLFKKEKFDYVYHMAGISPLPDCQSKAPYAVDVNVKGTTIVLDLSRKYNVKGVIFASTAAVYENTMTFPSVEDTVVAPSLIYPSTKYAAEQFCRAYYDAYKIPIVCLRFTNVYGPHIDCLRTQPPVMAYIIREFFNGRGPVLHSSGEQKRDFVYVDDLIDLAILVRKNKDFDIVNVSTERAISINEVTKLIRKEMKCENIEPEYRETAHFWHNYPNLYDDPYPIQEKLLTNEVEKYTCLSNKHAYEKYGWKPKTSIEDGIKITVDFTCKMLKK